jgi:hypothetical protein
MPGLLRCYAPRNDEEGGDTSRQKIAEKDDIFREKDDI